MTIFQGITTSYAHNKVWQHHHDCHYTPETVHPVILFFFIRGIIHHLWYSLVCSRLHYRAVMSEKDMVSHSTNLFSFTSVSYMKITMIILPEVFTIFSAVYISLHSLLLVSSSCTVISSCYGTFHITLTHQGSFSRCCFVLHLLLMLYTQSLPSCA